MNHWNDKDEFKLRVGEWAYKLHIDVRSVAIRPMTNKWASCSTNGRLNFNIELLDMDREIGDYVIVHELLHFSAPNHGKLWKMLMRVHLGDYESIEASLKETTLSRKSGETTRFPKPALEGLRPVSPALPVPGDSAEPELKKEVEE